MNPDVSLMIGDSKFNFRVACIVEHNDKILLHKSIHENFWNMVGGRVKSGEDTLTSLIREMKEELDINIENAKLIHVSENFFNYNNNNVQELLFVYHTYIDGEIVNKQDFYSLDNPNMIYHWYTREEIKNIVCLPKIIYTLIDQDINKLTHNIEH